MEKITVNLGNVSKISANLSGISFKQYEDYEGIYTVTPKAKENVQLFTKNKVMTENVNVESIPVYEVSNENGKTVVIG